MSCNLLYETIKELEFHTDKDICLNQIKSLKYIVKHNFPKSLKKICLKKLSQYKPIDKKEIPVECEEQPLSFSMLIDSII